jgi:hypothetical protein
MSPFPPNKTGALNVTRDLIKHDLEDALYQAAQQKMPSDSIKMVRTFFAQNQEIRFYGFFHEKRDCFFKWKYRYAMGAINISKSFNSIMMQDESPWRFDQGQVDPETVPDYDFVRAAYAKAFS